MNTPFIAKNYQISVVGVEMKQNYLVLLIGFASYSQCAPAFSDMFKNMIGKSSTPAPATSSPSTGSWFGSGKSSPVAPATQSPPTSGGSSWFGNVFGQKANPSGGTTTTTVPVSGAPAAPASAPAASSSGWGSWFNKGAAPNPSNSPAAVASKSGTSSAPPVAGGASVPASVANTAAVVPLANTAARPAQTNGTSTSAVPPSSPPGTAAIAPNATTGNSATPAAPASMVSHPDGKTILPAGTSFMARHTTRDDNEPGMDYTQCQTKVNKGPRDNVIGVDSKTFGTLVNGEITPMCGVIVQMKNPKNGNVAYGVILDRIWQNNGADVQFDVSPAISQALGYGGHNIGQIQVTIVDDFPASYTGSKDFGNMWKIPQDKAFGYPVCPGPPADPSKAEMKNGLKIIYNDKLKTHCVFEAGKRPLVRATPI